MKRSEFVAWIDEKALSSWEIAEQAEACGAKWEPEDLPKRLYLRTGAVVEDTGRCRHIVAAPREAPGRTERNAKILAAMVEAYNEQDRTMERLKEREP